jgi:glycerate-2-kinase
MILNKRELVNKRTCVRARRLVLGALEAALLAADPRRSVREKMKVKDNVLQIANKSYRLDRFDHIYVIGAGKASGSMAEALNEILGKKVTSGLVIIPNNFKANMNAGSIRLWVGTHPIPTERGVLGTRKMLELVAGATSKDLIIFLVSGGGSALMPLPFDGISIRQKRWITDVLLRSGASIEEMNAVRKHISGVKGGRLAEMLAQTKLISLIISDVVGDRLDTIASGPTVPDTTTYSDAMKVLKKYKLWKALDKNVARVIEDGVSGRIPETPKPGSRVFRRVDNILIANNRIACTAALNYLISRKLNSTILTTFVQGEARQVGVVAASIAREIQRSNQPQAKPASFVIGGETTVKVMGHGKGGRNQELVLSAAGVIDGLEETVIASIGTDGLDGNTKAAGAIADSHTLKRARKKKISLSKYLMNNDSNTFFRKLNDVILTGSTGTNVNDILVAVCL